MKVAIIVALVVFIILMAITVLTDEPLTQAETVAAQTYAARCLAKGQPYDACRKACNYNYDTFDETNVCRESLLRIIGE